jgi:3-oxoacyl-[acyl-carrier protein] reductase
VNNAGIYRFARLEEITEDEFHQHFNINVLGTILATREAVKYFGPNGGSVINQATSGLATFIRRRVLVSYRPHPPLHPFFSTR